MNLFDLAAKITLDSSEYEKGLDNAKGKTNGFASTIGNGLKTAAKVGAAAIGAATTAVGAFGVSSIKTGMDFDKSMSQVAATMGTTVDNIQELRNFAQEMGSTTAFSATQAADALNYMALAGYDAETSMSMLPNVLNLAAAGSIDLAAASDMVTDASSALGLDLSQTATMVDQMAAASSKSNTSVAQLGDAMLTIGGTARNLAGGTQELSTMLGVLADNGIKGAEGGTHLRNIILSLQNPTDDAAAALNALGVQVYDADGNMRSMIDIVGDLQAGIGGMDQASQDAMLSGIFNKTDLAAVQALMGTTTERFDELSAAIGDSTGAAQAMANTQLDNLAGDITLFESALEGAKIAVADELTPSLREFVQFGSKGLGTLTEAFKEGGLSGAMEALGGILSDGLSMVLGFVPKMVEAGMSLLSALGQGLLDNAPLIMQTALDIVMMLAQGLIENVGSLVDGAVTLISQLATFLEENADMMIQAAVNIILALCDALTDPRNINTLIKAGMSLLSALGQGLLDSAPLIMKAALDIIMVLAQGLIENVGSLVDGAVTLISQLATFLGENADMIIQAAIDIILALFDALTDPGNISTLIDAAIFLIISLAEALVTNIPELISRIPEIVMNLVNAFIENAPKLAEAGVELILMLVQGFFDEYSALINAVWEILGGIGDSLGEWGKSAMKIVKTIWNGILNLFKTVWNGIKSVFTTAQNAIKNNISSVFNGIKSYYSNIWNGIKGIFSNSLNSIKTTVTSVVNAIKNTFSTGFNAAKNTVLGVFDAIKSGITSKLEAAKNVVSNMIEKIKGFFNFKWSLPKIKLPHFSVSGSANPIDWLSQGVPKIKIDWYRKAYNSPYLFDKQTVIPFADGFKGFGDGAGAEIVYGRDNLMRDIREAIGGAGGYTQNVYITSPKQLSPSEIARQTRNATRNMVLSMRRV